MIADTFREHFEAARSEDWHLREILTNSHREFSPSSHAGRNIPSLHADLLSLLFLLAYII
jgi:hypothetical protein